MKKIFVMLICIVAAELALLQGDDGKVNFAATATPKIKIVTADVDLGEVEKNKIFDFKIEVKNVGEEDLVIISVSSSCGCLEVTDKRWVSSDGKPIEPEVLKPNHSIYIRAKVDTNKVSGDFEKMIHVYSNDSENKDVVWKVRGKVMDVGAESYSARNNGPIENRSLQKIQIITKDVDLGDVEQGKNFDYKIEVKNRGTEDLVIENVWSTCGCLSLTDERWAKEDKYGQTSAEPVIVKPDQSTNIAVRVATDKVTESGEFEKMLHIISNDPENKDVTWKVRGKMVGAKVIAIADYKTHIAKGEAKRKTVMVFYTLGCKDCREIMEKFLPTLAKKYKDKISVEAYNIDNPKFLAHLIDLEGQYEEKAKNKIFNPRPPIVFVENQFLYGEKEIRRDFEKLIRRK